MSGSRVFAWMCATVRAHARVRKDMCINTPLYQTIVLCLKFKFCATLPTTDKAMMRWRVIVGKLVGEVVSASSPVQEEVSLVNAIMYPVKYHVNCLEAPLFYSFIDKFSIAGIV
jgi:hypothetical protein